MLWQIPVPPVMLFPKVDLGAVLLAVIWLLSIGTCCYLTFVQTKKATETGRFKQLQEEADGWHRLATLRHEEIESLSRRVSEMEARLAAAAGNTTALQTLNLTLQNRNAELEAENLLLKARLTASGAH